MLPNLIQNRLPVQAVRTFRDVARRGEWCREAGNPREGERLMTAGQTEHGELHRDYRRWNFSSINTADCWVARRRESGNL